MVASASTCLFRDKGGFVWLHQHPPTCLKIRMMASAFIYLSRDEALDGEGEHDGAGVEEAGDIDEVVRLTVVLQDVTCNSSVKPT